MKYENINILKWGLNRNNNFYKKQKIKFPKKCPLTIDFNDKEIVGMAHNFKLNEKGIYCDISIDRKVTNTISPAFIVNDINLIDGHEYVSGIELISVSFIKDHSNLELNGNLTKGEK